MPMEWADPDLKGVEATAWRKTKTGYVTCGWGGKKMPAKRKRGEVLELYFDTRVVPEGILVQSSGSDQISLMVTRIDSRGVEAANDTEWRVAA